MNIVVLGASGATGSLLVEKLLQSGHDVKVVVRKISALAKEVLAHEKISITQASILNLSNSQLKDLVKDCDVIVSCLGHNLTLKGIYGNPRRLVRDTAIRIINVVEELNLSKPIKYILMNTAGNINRDLNEKISFTHKCILSLIRFLLPPHKDNEQASDYLRINIAQKNKKIQWVVVRPDSLINEEKVSDYGVYLSPTRSAILNAGQTSRINVADFMSELINNHNLWNIWSGKMPVIYNKE